MMCGANRNHNKIYSLTCAILQLLRRDLWLHACSGKWVGLNWDLSLLGHCRIGSKEMLYGQSILYVWCCGEVLVCWMKTHKFKVWSYGSCCLDKGQGILVFWTANWLKFAWTGGLVGILMQVVALYGEFGVGVQQIQGDWDHLLLCCFAMSELIEFCVFRLGDVWVMPSMVVCPLNHWNSQ